MDSDRGVPRSNIFGSKSISDKTNVTFISLQYLCDYPNAELKKTSYYNKYKPNFYIFKPVDWKERRILYEYYVDYKTIFDTAKSYDKACMIYYKTIEENKELYVYFGNICGTKSDDFPEFYNDCIPHNPTLVLPTLECPNQVKAPQVDAGDEQAIATHHNSDKALRATASSSETMLILESS
ncbi:PIR Superfamily Protein [Plasmodium ovale wallikeri]|uniref:PIR Superfamily Protein n=1 Tax=Plasmodium ovale wallikeri TaxID=864142 RepID=A0A1A9AGI9_PLAOA|nr:PIR Superfamily Protein [Plasmodium ovale wallikeri]